MAAIYRHYGIRPEATPDAGNGSGSGTDIASSSDSDSDASQRRQQPPAAQGNGGRRSSAPKGDSTGAMLKRTVKEFSDDNLTHWAAALTYYGVLSIFPALLATVSILGLIGSSAIQPLLDNLSTVAPGPAKEILTSALQGLQSGGGHLPALRDPPRGDA